VDPLASASAASVSSSLELARLGQLQARAAGGPGAKAADAAQGFEAMLLTQLIKGLRKTVPESPDSTAAGQMYQELFDEQLAQEVARNGGIGIARILESYLDRTGATASKNGVTGTPGVHRP
jgi:flagellar protein FlgJ